MSRSIAAEDRRVLLEFAKRVRDASGDSPREVLAALQEEAAEVIAYVEDAD